MASPVQTSSPPVDGRRAHWDLGTPPMEILRAPGPAERNPHGHAVVRRRTELAVAVAAPALALALWQWAARSGWINTQFFPAPSTIWSAGVEMVRSGDLQHNLYVSSRRVLLGFLLGVGSGTVVGAVMGMSRLLRAALEPMLSALYTVPKLALLPLLLLIFGIGETALVLLIAITVFFFMWISSMAAIMGVAEGHIEAVRSFGANRFQTFRHVLLPAAIPQLFVGLRLAAGVSVLVMVGIEFVQSSEGIGHLIWFSWSLFLPARMYVGIIVVALMGLVFTEVVKLLGRRAAPWAEDSSTSGHSQL
jgi:NitT/TauT family transport system permease protein/sulfonate transport system permease protein